MDKLNETLRNNAIGLGLCEQWQSEWNTDWDLDKLISKFYVGIDFCLANRFPANDFIKANIPIDTLHRWNVIVDEKRSILNAKDAAVFGSAHAIARYNARYCGRIYVRDNARLNVTARNNAFVIVHILDSARITAVAHDKADLVLIKHSRECSITTNANVRVIEEYDLY